MATTITVNGPQSPTGSVKVSGAKNSATRLLAAALVSCEPIRLRNFPTHLLDAQAKIDFMRKLGADVHVDHSLQTVEITTKSLTPKALPSYDLPIRTTYLLAAGQLLQNGHARVPYPSGCKIGSRGYDLHVHVWRSMGCRVNERQEFIEIEGQLKGARINFPISTVGGTENALICAAVAAGESEIRNAYITPEVRDLIELLIQMGATIENHGNSLIRVRGVNESLRGASFSVMPDRIEALTWMIFGAISGGSLIVEGVPFGDMEVPLMHLRDAGVDFYRNSNSVLVSPDTINDHGIQPFELACGAHPGVVSDMQPFFVLLGMKARGTSRIHDYRYPERIEYVRQLEKYCPGAAVAEPGRIITNGEGLLKAADTVSTDLRGSMALLIAACCATGTSHISGVEMALRGYNDLAAKLSGLGIVVEVDERN